ncbi:MAG: Minf_1886 family protein [Chthoniobacteraceae bacterium]
MDQSKFEEALDEIIAHETRYARAAYYFLRDALEYTRKERKKSTGETGHVTGQQLLEGVRRYGLKQFGPMVPSVFEHWRIQSTEDFGHMVFALVAVGIFGKTERDSISDFRGVYDFHDAFVAPFLPAPKADAPPVRIVVDSPAEELN